MALGARHASVLFVVDIRCMASETSVMLKQQGWQGAGKRCHSKASASLHGLAYQIQAVHKDLWLTPLLVSLFDKSTFPTLSARL